MKSMTALTGKVVLFTLSTTSFAYGQSQSVDEQSEFEISIGVGAGSGQSLYKGIDDSTEAMPMLDIRYGNLFFGNGGLGYILTEQDDFSAYMALGYDSLDGERTDSKILKDMGDVDRGLNLIIGSEFATDFGFIDLSVAHDVSGEHSGSQVGVGWSVPLEAGDVMLMPSLSVAWMSDDLVNHYFGVSASQARPGRSAYKTDSGWRYGVDLMASYPLSEHWELQGGVGVEWYSSEITDSPIVDRDSVVSGFMGLSYHF